MRDIILASSSIYRRRLLAKLKINFSHQSPEIDESSIAGESLEQLSLRLAIEKAKALQPLYPNALIIGSDQVASLKGQRLHKPGNHAQATKQLKQCSGQDVVFFTSICVINNSTEKQQVSVEINTVSFRKLNTTQIERYLKLEKPYDCAGSFKMEGLGISLFTHIKGDDPNALIGLPLIRLVDMLSHEDINIP